MLPRNYTLPQLQGLLDRWPDEFGGGIQSVNPGSG